MVRRASRRRRQTWRRADALKLARGPGGRRMRALLRRTASWEARS
jgi:hypothetical protein